MSNTRYYALALAAFATRRVLIPGLLFSCLAGCGTAPLVVAVNRGDTAAVDAQLARGADVNARDRNGMTALMYASQQDALAIVQALLAKGADVNACLLYTSDAADE